MKLNKLLKELATYKDLLLDKYSEIERLRQMNERLSQRSVDLSKDVKELKSYVSKVENDNKRLKDELQGKSED